MIAGGLLSNLFVGGGGRGMVVNSSTFRISMKEYEDMQPKVGEIRTTDIRKADG